MTKEAVSHLQCKEAVLSYLPTVLRRQWAHTPAWRLAAPLMWAALSHISHHAF